MTANAANTANTDAITATDGPPPATVVPNLVHRLRIRPYLLTGGRTKPSTDLAFETLLRTSDDGAAELSKLQLERRRIVQLCLAPISIAELAARLTLPIQVARVLVDDLMTEGLIAAHTPSQTADERPDLNLLERVLDGLQRL